MVKKPSFVSLLATMLLLVPALAISQLKDEKRTLILNGQDVQVPRIELNGYTYVDLKALTDALKGSLSSSGNRIALSVPIGSPNCTPPVLESKSASHASAPDASPNPGFSREFLNAGIEQMSTLREWHTVLVTAIQNGIPVSNDLLAPFRAKASTNLRLVSVAATTPSDHSAYQLLSHEFQSMAKLADKYVSMRAKMTYISPDALQNDDLNQHLIACGRSLGAIVASGQFVDDGSCH